MSKYIVINGDKVTFQSTFGAATAGPIPPITIMGSGHAKILGEKVCIDGDEKRVTLSCTYKTDVYKTPGTCSLSIEDLASDQTADHTFNGEKVITVGNEFTAKLDVIVPAQTTSTTPVSDNNTTYKGNGKFENTQSFVTAE